MVAPKTSPITFPLRQGPTFRPLASAQKKPSLQTIDEIRAWFRRVPGKAYANEATIPGSGAWPVFGPPPVGGLIEVIRVTLPRPDCVTLIFHPWVAADTRFRLAIRQYAELDDATYFGQMGRIVVEWGVGAAKNWTYCDMNAGSLSIPNAEWVSVSGWSYSMTVRLGVTAQIGYYHPNANAFWSCIHSDLAATQFGCILPNYAREITGYFRANTLNEAGYIALFDFMGLQTQRWLMRPAITPNPQVIPYPPVSVPIAGGVNSILVGISVANPPNLAVASAVVTVRI